MFLGNPILGLNVLDSNDFPKIWQNSWTGKKLKYTEQRHFNAKRTEEHYAPIAADENKLT